MSGMNAQTGKALSGLDHIQQSVKDIIMTPIGSRVYEKEYGSYVMEMLGKPGNPTNILKLTSVLVLAIMRWETRILPIRIQLIDGETQNGKFDFQIDAVLTQPIDNLTSGTPINFNVLVGV